MNTNELFLYLTACSLSLTSPDETMLAGADWEQLFHAAKKQSMVCIIWYTVEKTEAFENADSRIKAVWREAEEKAIRKCLLMDTERAALTAEFEKEEIRYMPLKGIILKDYYPQYGMREMADNDFLIDPRKRAEVRKIFEQRGYQVNSYSRSNHDVYVKAPVLNFEMHTELFHPDSYPDLAREYKNVWECLIKDSGNDYGYHFSDEDYYVFELAHAYKHFRHSGTGVRTLADLFVLNRQMKDKLNWGSIAKKLNALGILDFEQKSVSLAEKLFAVPCPLTCLGLTEEESALLSYYMDSGTYGNTDFRVKNDLRKLNSDADRITAKTKMRYLLSRLFPGRTWCRTSYPVIYRFPVLLPFFWVWRILFRGLKHFQRCWKEWKTVIRTK